MTRAMKIAASLALLIIAVPIISVAKGFVWAAMGWTDLALAERIAWNFYFLAMYSTLIPLWRSIYK